MSLQHDSAIPLYIQIKTLLQTQIEDGLFTVGSRLPSERELAERYAVSRMTARQALRLLAQEGLTHTRVGKGTFVSAPKIDQELRALTSFSEDIRQRGLTPSSRLLTAAVRLVDELMAKRLRIDPGSEIVVLSRVRLADDQPLALETTHLPHHLCPQLLNRYDFNRESLYQVLRRDYGLALVWADQLIETRLPKPDECDALKLDKSIPVMKFTRVTYNEQDHPVEFVRSVYRGDQYQLRVILHYSEHQVR
ncbi:MAG: GntR family transcriptional regulator [Anaerolineae bacterium]|nr:GntR family transcriptional regulator [Anaerolineae bacterium]